MPKMIGTPLAVTGDDRNGPFPLSEPSGVGLKLVMDHTRKANQARTNFKAPARILKQSEGHSEGALK